MDGVLVRAVGAGVGVVWLEGLGVGAGLMEEKAEVCEKPGSEAREGPGPVGFPSVAVDGVVCEWDREADGNCCAEEGGCPDTCWGGG